MKFTETPLKGAYIVEIEPIHDERGFFTRTWCTEEFKARGLDPNTVQCSSSLNLKKGTLRGMHYQAAPHEEAKVVRCTMGAAQDVILDLRQDSSTYKEWFALELTAENRKAIYIPKGFAHGYQTLTDNTEIFYQISVLWHPPSGRGVRWDDPAFGIKWALKPTVISAKDAAYPNYLESR